MIKPRWWITALSMGALFLVLLLSGCDISEIAADATPTGAPSRPTSTAGTGKATAALAHIPVGSGDLTWDPTSQSLRLFVSLVGLAPGSTHPTEIRAGTCTGGGAVVYTLPNLVADASGAAHIVPTIDQVSGGIPNNKWFLAVHNVVGSDPYQALLIACANISNANTATNKQQVAHVLLTQGQGPSQGASGTAQLSVANDTLNVTVKMTGLEANSTHPAFIRFGSCAVQSAEAFHALPPLQANTSGAATSTFTLGGVNSIPVYGWYVMVHRGTNLDSAIDFDPIACGNVVPA